MRQLTGFDSSFLYAETPRAHMAGGGVSIYDPSTAPGGQVTFKGILAHIESRLHEARMFRERLVRVPFDLDHPYWIEDPDFDIEYHVRHIALPKPGDWRQLCIQVARLHARPMDLSKPLWEFTIIEGLPGMIERRRMPKASDPSQCVPWSSGPRCRVTRPMVRNASGAAGEPSRARMP